MREDGNLISRIVLSKLFYETIKETTLWPSIVSCKFLNQFLGYYILKGSCINIVFKSEFNIIVFLNK